MVASLRAIRCVRHSGLRLCRPFREQARSHRGAGFQVDSPAFFNAVRVSFRDNSLLA